MKSKKGREKEKFVNVLGSLGLVFYVIKRVLGEKGVKRLIKNWCLLLGRFCFKTIRCARWGNNE